MSWLGGFKNFLSGGPGYEWEQRANQEEQINAARDRDAQNRAAQEQLAQMMMARVNGEGLSVAESQLAQTTADNQRQQMAMARSGTGGALGNSAAQYGAARNAAQTNQQANQQGASLRAQEQAAYMQQLADQYSAQREQDQAMGAQEFDYELQNKGLWADQQAAKAGASEAGARRNAGGGLLGGFAQAYGAFRSGGSSGGST